MNNQALHNRVLSSINVLREAGCSFSITDLAGRTHLGNQKARDDNKRALEALFRPQRTVAPVSAHAATIAEQRRNAKISLIEKDRGVFAALPEGFSTYSPKEITSIITKIRNGGEISLDSSKTDAKTLSQRVRSVIENKFGPGLFSVKTEKATNTLRITRR